MNSMCESAKKYGRLTLAVAFSFAVLLIVAQFNLQEATNALLSAPRLDKMGNVIGRTVYGEHVYGWPFIALEWQEPWTRKIGVEKPLAVPGEWIVQRWSGLVVNPLVLFSLAWGAFMGVYRLLELKWPLWEFGLAAVTCAISVMFLKTYWEAANASRGWDYVGRGIFLLEVNYRPFPLEYGFNWRGILVAVSLLFFVHHSLRVVFLFFCFLLKQIAR